MYVLTQPELHVDLDQPVDEYRPHLGVDVGLVVHVLRWGVGSLGGVEVLEHVGHVRRGPEGVGSEGDVLGGQAGGEVGAVEGRADEAVFGWEEGGGAVGVGGRGRLLGIAPSLLDILLGLGPLARGGDNDAAAGRGRGQVGKPDGRGSKLAAAGPAAAAATAAGRAAPPRLLLDPLVGLGGGRLLLSVGGGPAVRRRLRLGRLALLARDGRRGRRRQLGPPVGLGPGRPLAAGGGRGAGSRGRR